MATDAPLITGSSGAWQAAHRRGLLPQGAIIGGHRVGEILGQGGMATVYAARHAEHGGEAAIKVMRRSAARDASAIERFRREATAVQRIAHPGIAGVFAIGWLPDGRPFAVMERLRGETLKQRLLRGPLALDEIAPVIVPIAGALQATHAHGIVHRDLKPENVFLSDRGTRLLDFGIAQFSQAFDAPGRLTGPGFVVGTPNYISPEQAQGRDQVPATDVYGLGVVLFEMLTGRLPFEGNNAAAMLSHHLMSPPPRVAALARVPAVLDELVARMLAKAPADRPTLDEVCATVTLAEVRRPRRRLVSLAITIALALATTAGLAYWANGPP